MQLVEQDRLDLDRDVNDYLDFRIPTPEGGVPATLCRLMTLSLMPIMWRTTFLDRLA